MKVRRFDPADDLIIVKAQLYGPRGYRPLSLAFDTAASETHIVPAIVDDLGYSPLQGESITSVSSAIGKEPGYMLRVARFASLGFSFPDFAVHVHDLPDVQRSATTTTRVALNAWMEAMDHLMPSG